MNLEDFRGRVCAWTDGGGPEGWWQNFEELGSAFGAGGVEVGYFSGLDAWEWIREEEDWIW